MAEGTDGNRQRAVQQPKRSTQKIDVFRAKLIKLKGDV